MIEVNSNSSVPIYEQIQAGIKELILKNGIREEEKLPSVRELAYKLTINPNTITKAYNQLENDDIISTIKGKGTFVRKGAKNSIKKDELIQLKEDIRKVIVDSIKLDLALEVIIEIERNFYRELGRKDK